MAVEEHLRWMDATEQADLIRSGELSPEEAVSAAIDRIHALNPILNAVVTPTFEQGLSSLAEAPPEGMFAGVPFLVKDLGAAMAGVRQSNGSRLLRDYVAPDDGEIVQKYRRAGLAILGRTNTSEFGATCTTEPELWGPTRNPWNLSHSPGGSSGGSAAAVASGMVPVAHGSDGAGSIRIPSSCCGLFGFKPTRGRTPQGPGGSDLVVPLVSEHVLSRTVRDSAAFLDLSLATAEHEFYRPPGPARPYREEVQESAWKSLRIAATCQPNISVDVEPECRQAVEDAASLCTELGHNVTWEAPEFDRERLRSALDKVWAVYDALALESASKMAGGYGSSEVVEASTLALANRGYSVDAVSYLEALDDLKSVIREYGRLFDRYDVLLTPTLAKLPIELGEWKGTPAEPVRHSFIPFTSLANVSGQPAMSVPTFWSASGLPIGTHFVARFGREDVLFALASQLEANRPWRDRHPVIPETQDS